MTIKPETDIVTETRTIRLVVAYSIDIGLKQLACGMVKSAVCTIT